MRLRKWSWFEWTALFGFGLPSFVLTAIPLLVLFVTGLLRAHNWQSFIFLIPVAGLFSLFLNILFPSEEIRRLPSFRGFILLTGIPALLFCVYAVVVSLSVSISSVRMSGWPALLGNVPRNMFVLDSSLLYLFLSLGLIGCGLHYLFPLLRSK